MSIDAGAAPAATYDVVSVVFHWITAFLVIAIFAPLAEGRHERLWTVLGAHVRRYEDEVLNRYLPPG